MMNPGDMQGQHIIHKYLHTQLSWMENGHFFKTEEIFSMNVLI